MGLPFPFAAEEPRSPAPPGGPGSEPGREKRPQSALPRPVVLLVEDNVFDVRVITRALRGDALDIDIQVTEDGDAALSVLAESAATARRAPSLILLDWNLPRVSGADVLAFIRRSEYLKHIPVVVVTSTESPSEVAQIRRLGANAHFRKPADLEAYLTLRTIVADLLSKPPRPPS
jgi:CheY-like chemotaxis protein